MYVVLQLLEKSDELVVFALQHLKNATVMHEINRQNIMNASILPPLKRLLSGHSNEVKHIQPNAVSVNEQQMIFGVYYTGRCSKRHAQHFEA